MLYTSLFKFFFVLNYEYFIHQNLVKTKYMILTGLADNVYVDWMLCCTNKKFVTLLLNVHHKLSNLGKGNKPLHSSFLPWSWLVIKTLVSLGKYIWNYILHVFIEFQLYESIFNFQSELRHKNHTNVSNILWAIKIEFNLKCQEWCLKFISSKQKTNMHFL